MSTLIPYNAGSNLLPFGFRNLGVTCYFNALVQSLLSCTSFMEEIMQDKKKYKTNPVSNTLIEIIKTAKYYEDLCQKSGVSDSEQNYKNEIDAIISDTKKKLNNFWFGFTYSMIIRYNIIDNINIFLFKIFFKID